MSGEKAPSGAVPTLSGQPETDGGQWPQSFDDPLCDEPGYLDPLHLDEVSCRCQMTKGHDGPHTGYLPAQWPNRRT